MMTQWEDFQRQTHDALVNLYDVQRLERHALTRLFAKESRAEQVGRSLRRLLLEAIQSVKPPPDTPPESQSASRYQFLYLRYVQGQPISRIARTLAITERQVYRRQREAIEAVSTVLWRRIQPSTPSPFERDAHDPHDSRMGRNPGIIHLEVDRIGETIPQASTDLRQILDGALATVSRLIQPGRSPIAITIGPDLAPVAADRTAIRQAVLGVLVFAIESCAEGEIRVVAASTDSEAIVNVQIPVSSMQIDAGHLLEDSNLAVSSRLVELQGGTLSLHDKEYSLEVVFSLPVARPRTVLIVDDNLDTLDLFTRYLEGRDYRVKAVPTGEEAVEVAVETRPDAIILDVMLPSADGWEVLQSIRSHPDTADVPVVVCTVLRQHDLAMALGATAFLAKPATQGDLLAALQQCWSRTHPAL